MEICHELYIVLFKVGKYFQIRSWTGPCCDEETVKFPWSTKPKAMLEKKKASLKVFAMEKMLDAVEVICCQKLEFSLKSQQLLGGGSSPVWRRKEGFQLLPNDHA